MGRALGAVNTVRGLHDPETVGAATLEVGEAMLGGGFGRSLAYMERNIEEGRNLRGAAWAAAAFVEGIGLGAVGGGVAKVGTRAAMSADAGAAPGLRMASEFAPETPIVGKIAGATQPTNYSVVRRPGEAYEYYYRSMSRAHYDEFVKSGRIPASSETFVSPTLQFAQSYKGVTVRFQVAGGTTRALRSIGVRSHGNKAAELLTDLSEVRRGWINQKELFKSEGTQINIGLGRGRALDIFNDSIAGYEVMGVIR